MKFILRILVLNFLLVISAKLSASVWIDPYFDEAIQEAGLICVGNVVTSTNSYSEVLVTRIYKGNEKEGDTIKIYRARSGEDHDDDKLPIGRDFFFIVKSDSNDYKAFTDTYWVFGVNDTLIRVPIRDPLAPCTMERIDFDPFLLLLLGKGTAEMKNDLLKKAVYYLNNSTALTKDPKQVDRQFFAIEVIEYFGGEEFAPEVIRFINSPYYNIRWQCVNALSKCGGDLSEETILTMLDEEETAQVQSVLGKAVFNLNILNAKNILEELIPEASAEKVMLSSDLMNPVFNFLPPPRYSFAAALMHINGIDGDYDNLLKDAPEYTRTSKTFKLNPLENAQTYYSLEEALKNSDSVIELFLSKQNLAAVPAEIRLLRNLKSLNLSQNNISELPDFLSDLGLIELDLTKNKLSVLPDELFECKSLETLYLGDNEFDTLDGRIGNLLNLKKLVIGGGKCNQLPESIGALSNLRELNCRMGKLTTLPDSFAKLDKLREVEMYGNKFYKFPDQLISCEELREIRMGSNQIKSVPEEILSMKKLRYVDISYNFLSRQERDRIGNFPAGVIFNYEGNYDVYYSVTEAIEEHDKSLVKGLNDSHNDYSENAFELTGLNSAKYVFMNDDQLPVFPVGITNLDAIVHIQLSDNKISKFPEDLCNLSQITRLDLSGNLLNSIPDNINCLQSLQYLLLSNNQINLVPNAIGEMKNLITIDLKGNKLTTLPDSMAGMKIKYLYLANNQFSAEEKEKISAWFDGNCTIEW